MKRSGVGLHKCLQWTGCFIVQAKEIKEIVFGPEEINCGFVSLKERFGSSLDHGFIMDVVIPYEEQNILVSTNALHLHLARKISTDNVRSCNKFDEDMMV